MNPPVRVAVIGVGEMGANHARVYQQLKDVELVAVVDADAAKAEETGRRHSCDWHTSPEQLAGSVDACSVAVPSSLHAEVAVPLLRAGIACLVEKPLGVTSEDAAAIMQASEDTGSALLVGHIERFNPAVDQLRQILTSQEVIAVDARRMSAVSGRINDVDVVADLMVHDIDIVLDLLGELPIDIVARGLRTGDSGTDYAVAVLRFASGALATVTASRVTQNQIRELQVSTRERLFTVDYPAQELLIFQQGRIGGLLGAAPGAEGRYVLDVNTERVFVRRTEPLAQELAHFVRVARGKEAARVSGGAALRALEVVWEVQRQIGETT